MWLLLGLPLNFGNRCHYLLPLYAKIGSYITESTVHIKNTNW